MKKRRFLSHSIVISVALYSHLVRAVTSPDTQKIEHFYLGTLKGQGSLLPIGVEFIVNGSHISGQYFYQGRTGEIALQGSISPSGDVEVTESSNGKISGTWKGRFLKAPHFDKSMQKELKEPEKTSFSGSWQGQSEKSFEISLTRIDVKACATCSVYPDSSSGFDSIRFHEDRGPVVSIGDFKYRIITKLQGEAVGKYPIFIASPKSVDIKKLNNRALDHSGVGETEFLNPECPSQVGASVSFPSSEVLKVDSNYESGCGAYPSEGASALLIDTKTGTEIKFENLFKDGKEDLIPLLRKFVKDYVNANKASLQHGETLCFDESMLESDGSTSRLLDLAELSSVTSEGVVISFQFPHVNAVCDQKTLIPMNKAIQYAAKNSVLKRINSHRH